VVQAARIETQDRGTESPTGFLSSTTILSPAK
jgi:hypothetical protein